MDCGAIQPYEGSVLALDLVLVLVCCFGFAFLFLVFCFWFFVFGFLVLVLFLVLFLVLVWFWFGLVLVLVLALVLVLFWFESERDNTQRNTTHTQCLAKAHGLNLVREIPTVDKHFETASKTFSDAVKRVLRDGRASRTVGPKTKGVLTRLRKRPAPKGIGWNALTAIEKFLKKLPDKRWVLAPSEMLAKESASNLCVCVVHFGYPCDSPRCRVDPICRTLHHCTVCGKNYCDRHRNTCPPSHPITARRFMDEYSQKLGDIPMAQHRWSILHISDHAADPLDHLNADKMKYWMRWAGPWEDGPWLTLTEMSMNADDDTVTQYWRQKNLAAPHSLLSPSNAEEAAAHSLLSPANAEEAAPRSLLSPSNAEETKETEVEAVEVAQGDGQRQEESQGNNTDGDDSDPAGSNPPPSKSRRVASVLAVPTRPNNGELL